MDAAERREGITKEGINAFAVPTCSLEKEKRKNDANYMEMLHFEEVKITRQPMGRHSWHSGLLLLSMLNG